MARSGQFVFGVVWAGQLVSTVGSGLTSFALGLWVLGQTGSVTSYVLIGLCVVTPRVLLSPVAGVLVDRWDRRILMLVADLGGLAISASLLALVAIGRLELWGIYLAAAVGGVLSSFSWPAWAASTSLLVPPKHLGRAAGLGMLAQAASDVFAPVPAAALFLTVGIVPILGLDVISFAASALALAVVRFPDVSPAAGALVRSVVAQLGDGWRYMRVRPELLALLAFLATLSLVDGFIGALIVPLVLGFDSAQGVGLVLSAAGLGMVGGSLVMAAWGGPSRRVLGVIVGELASGAAFLAMGLRPELALVAAGACVAHFAAPIVFASNQAIWQVRVPPELQGRVFATRQMVERSMTPIAYIVAGPLVERVLGPLVRSEGSVGNVLRGVLGAGDARGIGLLFVMLGLAQVALAVRGLGFIRLRVVDLSGGTADATAPELSCG
jgi:MFS family permease